MLTVLYHDKDLVAVNKPPGLLVHRTKLDPRENVAALQLVRDQIGQRVFPVHRLDRPTSGVLIFALNEDVARWMSEKFAAREVAKKYVSIVRGIPKQDSWTINYSLVEELDAMTDRLANEDKPAQDAVTEVECLDSVELPVMVDKFPTSRYALLECRPKTGRKHQIRRHLRHEGHPIIGDVTHGAGKHNRFFAAQFGIRRLLLSCTEISFPHPCSNETVSVKAPLDSEFLNLLERLGWSRHAPA
jgi:tRNA pseudouridine65 synthase